MLGRRVTLGSVVFAVAAVFALALVVEEIPRILFPWDLRIFSEAALLTDMLKLRAGQSTYTSPADCNSFIYAPGLEYVTYALLRPFGAELDIRACRAVCFLIGMGGAAFAGRHAATFTRLLSGEARAARWHVFVAATIAALVVSRSYTSDACHPDNLYILHATVLLALTFLATTSGRFAHALAVVAFGALALLIKQTAALGAVGATLLLFYEHGRKWGLARCASLALWGLAWGLGAAFALLHGWGKFWTMTVPSSQPVEWFRLYKLLSTYVSQMPFRPLLAIACAPSVFFLALRARENDELRRMLVSWAVVGCTEVSTSLISYFKAWGFWNNVTIIDVWMLMPIAGAAFHYLRPVEGGGAIERRAAASGFLVTLFVASTPTRVWPTHEEYEAGRALDASIARDVAAGKHVTTTFPVAPLIHAGLTDVALDRHGSNAELMVAHLDRNANTKSRIESRYYDKIYVIWTARWSDETMAAVTANYHEVDSMPAVRPPPNVDWDFLGNMWFLQEGIRVYEANR